MSNVWAESLVDDSDEPVEPVMKTIKVNYIAVVYTCKLAMHYFSKQDEARDRCLIIKGSLASYLDLPGGPEYQSSKYGVRGLFCCLRKSGRMRVNLLAPWWANTGIVTDSLAKHIDEMLNRVGSEWVHLEDAAGCCLRIASDEAVQGRRPPELPSVPLNMLAGRAFMICSREMDKSGYVDLTADDYEKRDDVKWLHHISNSTHLIGTETSLLTSRSTTRSQRSRVDTRIQNH